LFNDCGKGGNEPIFKGGGGGRRLETPTIDGGGGN